MLKDFDQPVLNITGEPVKDGGVTLYFKDIIAKEMILPANRDERIPADVSLKRYALAQRIINGGVVDISVDEAAIIKKAFESYAPLIYGRIVDFVEGDRSPKTKTKPVKE